MELTIIAPTTAQRSAVVAPAFGRVRGGVRPQGHTSLVDIDVLAAAGMAAGYRLWSPPIT